MINSSKQYRQISFWGIIVFLVLFLSPSPVTACSYIFLPTSVKQIVENNDHVVILRLKSIEKYKTVETGNGRKGIKQSVFTVEKVFKGDLQVGQELTFSQGSGSDCIWYAEENQLGKYHLFYLENSYRMRIPSPADSPKEIWNVFIYSHSGKLENKTADLKYLENIEKVKEKTRISGSVYQLLGSNLKSNEEKYTKLSNIGIRIIGNGKDINLKTDDDGDYEIYDLPFGKYIISVEPISGYTERFEVSKNISRKIELKQKNPKNKGNPFLSEQAEIDFTFFIDNSITGKLFDSTGKALKGVCLDLYPVDGEVSSKFRRIFDFTDKNGKFEFKQIPAGKYIIVANDDVKITEDKPRTFYYPNKLKKDDAQIVTIGAGEHIKDLVITEPAIYLQKTKTE